MEPMMQSEQNHPRTKPHRALVTLLAIALAGCSVFGPEPSQETPTSDPESVNVGYTLLYTIVSAQKNSDKILLIKRVSPQVEKVIKDISNATGDMDADLKKFAKEDPNIVLDRSVLPLIEEKQRESATLERGLQFIGTSGKPFERLLLLTQSGLLTTERHVSRVMRDSEANPDRKAFWEQATKTFDKLYAELVKLLENEYFSP
jgi:hypothetical protein